MKDKLFTLKLRRRGPRSENLRIHLQRRELSHARTEATSVGNRWNPSMMPLTNPMPWGRRRGNQTRLGQNLSHLILQKTTTKWNTNQRKFSPFGFTKFSRQKENERETLFFLECRKKRALSTRSVKVMPDRRVKLRVWSGNWKINRNLIKLN